MNISVKIGIGLTLLLLVSVACALAENAEYTAVVYAPANLSVGIVLQNKPTDCRCDSLAFDTSGNTHISYRYGTNGDLKYAVRISDNKSLGGAEQHGRYRSKSGSTVCRCHKWIIRADLQK